MNSAPEALSAQVTIAVSAGVARVVMSGREGRNALTDELASGLLAAVERVTVDRSIRVVLLAATGRNFCVGADLRLLAGGGIDPGFGDLVHRGVLGIHRSSVPWVAAIHGAAAGYGVGLACACDIRVAADDARFLPGFIGIGLSPDSTTSYFLPRLLGPSRARSFLLANRQLEAKEALVSGFVLSLHPPGDLERASEELAESIAALPSGALTRAKQLLEASHAATAEEQAAHELAKMLESVSTPDFAEGVAAFLAKRPPRFSPERGA